MTEQTPVQIHRKMQRRKQYTGFPFYLKLALLMLLIAVPFLFPAFKTVDLALNIIIFSVLVTSFDLLLGYTGILSFGHVMFFGIGAYSVAMLTGKYGDPTYANLCLGFLIAIGITLLIALLISFLSLRVKAIFFAMVTLAIAEFAIIFATKASEFTGGEDGILLSSFGVFKRSFNLGEFLGRDINGKMITYYFILTICVVLFLLMMRFIESPLGRVMQAIRDNEPRAEAIGYKTFLFKTISICFGCLIATILGSLYVIWTGYANPESVLGTPIMVDVLLMVIIGGMGTLYGGIAGAAFVLIAYTFLPDLQKIAESLFPNIPFLHALMERWHLILGILFILVVLFFPKGIIGSIREYVARRKVAVAA